MGMTKPSINFIENILALVPGNVFWLDREGIFRGCNNNMLKLLGLKSLSDYVGKTYEDLYETKHIQLIKANDQKVMAQNKPMVFEEVALNKDGTQLIYLTKKTPLHDDQGNVIGLLGTSIDVTDRKRAEQLEQDKVRAEERAETLRLITASIAHELRTPLRAVMAGAAGIATRLPRLMEGYTLAKAAQLQVPYLSPSDLQSFPSVFENIQSEAKSASQVVDMLLMKTDTDKIHAMEQAVCSMKQCVESALSRYVLNAEEREHIHSRVQDFRFRGNALLIVHVLFNLLQNALYSIKAAGKGEITLWTELGKPYHTVHVKDTGQGISESVLPQIFDRFFTQTTHGTGVGLAFCRMVMHSIDGEITCQAEAGEYAEFILKFPHDPTLD